MAMLRGMGWQPGKGMGKHSKYDIFSTLFYITADSNTSSAVTPKTCAILNRQNTDSAENIFKSHLIPDKFCCLFNLFQKIKQRS